MISAGSCDRLLLYTYAVPPRVLSLGSAQILKALVNSQHLVCFASPEQA
eukprot:COSAG01_NODE_4156_length_5291_cov_4.177196_3_plen_49_part_00